jgi:hypothetical protein
LPVVLAALGEGNPGGEESVKTLRYD